ncbi:MAG: nicotinamide riboside transporter PnuC [Erysipelotrichaceae bacterium]|nr:nicotinamide riboside transporter PnuC [Erysipelotrichaceae bacterium]
MIKSIKENFEPNKLIRNIEICVLVLLVAVSAICFAIGFKKVGSYDGELTYVGSLQMERLFDEEDYDEDSTVCDVIFESDEKQMVVTYSYEEYEELDIESITAYEYVMEDGNSLCFANENPTNEEVLSAYQQVMTVETMPIFNGGISALILLMSVALILCYSKFFTTYEKSWFITIMVLATFVSVLFPEESANGINGVVIMLLYLLDTFFNILCELLISKQSRYNFLVSVVVEILEILICVVLMYRFATMVTTLFFWLPIDIASFINWTKHKDDQEDELTVVRRLKGYQEVLIILAIIVWTVVVGYFLSGLDIQTDFFGGNRNLEVAIAYMDACASAVGVANGLFIFFRLREQWVAWYICAILEGLINIVTGQYVLLVLKLGYITNTTYGYIKWSKYIKEHKEEKLTLL